MTKHTFKWYRDKGFWTNVGAFVAAIGAYFTGDVDQGTAIATALLAAVNALLRYLGRNTVSP